MPVKSLNPTQELVVVSAVDQNLQQVEDHYEYDPTALLDCLQQLFVTAGCGTWEFVFTLVVSTDRGPVRNSSSSFFSNSSTDIGAAIFSELRVYDLRRSSY